MDEQMKMDLINAIREAIIIANQYVSNEACYEVKQLLKDVLLKYGIPL